MKRFGFSLAIWLTLTGAVCAQGGMMPGPGTVHSAAAGYTGPGDIVSSAYLWVSCSRGYNTADTANACEVCLPSDTVCADITLTNGFAVVPGSLSTCNITTVICTVKTLYDKTGGGNPMVQATESKRPTFRPAMASNGCPTTALPCMLFTAANSQEIKTAGNVVKAQPVTFSFVYIRGGGGGEPISHIDPEVILPSGQIQIFTGSNGAPTATAANGSWHAAQAIFNGASSAIYVDGSATTGLTVATTGASLRPSLGTLQVSAFFDGFLAEVGFWAVGFNGTQAGDMNTNQHGANGYNF